MSAGRREDRRTIGVRGLWWRRTKYVPGLGVCRCAVCHAALKAAESLPFGSEPAAGSIVSGCLYVNRERCFAEAWQREHRFSDLLQALLRRPLKPGERSFNLNTPIAFVATMRDRIVAATVIQWLGSNCGFDFLRIALECCGYRLVAVEDDPSYRIHGEVPTADACRAEGA